MPWCGFYGVPFFSKEWERAVAMSMAMPEVEMEGPHWVEQVDSIYPPEVQHNH